MILHINNVCNEFCELSVLTKGNHTICFLDLTHVFPIALKELYVKRKKKKCNYQNRMLRHDSFYIVSLISMSYVSEIFA